MRPARTPGRPREAANEQRKNASREGASRARTRGPTGSYRQQTSARTNRSQKFEYSAAAGGRSYEALPGDERGNRGSDRWKTTAGDVYTDAA